MMSEAENQPLASTGKHWMWAVVECVHVGMAVAYVSIFFIAERLFPLAFLPAYLLNKLIPWTRLAQRMPFVFVAMGTGALAFGAAGGMRLAVGPVQTILVSLAWLVCLGIVCTAYFMAAATPPSLAAIEERISRSWPQRWYAKRLRKPIDAHYVGAIILNSFMAVPAVVALILPGTLNAYNVFYYIVALMVIARLHEELDHCDIHNNFFVVRHLASKKDKAVVWLTGKYLRLLLNPACSRIPHFYRAHHVYMHHVENNGVHDLQTTVFRDRTSFFDFCKHALMLGVSNSFGIDLFFYFRKRGNDKERRLLVLGLALWFGALALIALYSPAAAVVVLVIHFLGAVPGAINTYVWHGIVDLDDTENVYRNSVNSVMGDKRMSVGSLHLRHHLKGGEHWTRQYAMSEDDMRACARNDAVLLRPIQANLLMKSLWMRRLDIIAERIVPFEEGGRNPAETAAMVWSRTRPLIAQPRPRLYRYLDERVGRFYSTVVLPGKLP